MDSLPTEGLLESGNINLYNRPVVKQPDGSIATVKSIGVNIDGKEMLLPTVSNDGRMMTNDEAIQQYKQTGKHLGIFNSPEAASNYAKALSSAQGKYYSKKLKELSKQRTQHINAIKK